MVFERDNIRRLKPYVPGEQPCDAHSGRIIKLNTNENPFPPAPAVIEAIREIDADALRLYPPAQAPRFRAAAAKVHGVGPQQIIATNGGDELLRLAVTVFCEPGVADGAHAPGTASGGPQATRTKNSENRDGQRGGIGATEPSYSLYGVLGSIHDTAITVVPRASDFSLPDDVAQRWNDAGCRLGFLVNPHAPSGRLEPVEALASIATEFSGVLLIDEAYVDFAVGDALSLVQSDTGLANVLLLRTLSKGYSLAGLRFGYGIGSADLIAALDKARDSYNTDIVSQIAATTALEHREVARQCWQKVRGERRRLSGELEKRGYRVFPSEANFILAVPPATGPGAQEIYQTLKNRGILVRYFDTDPLADKLRITVGSAEDNNAMLATLDA